MTKRHDDRAGQHILLTALGAQSRMTRYSLNGVSAEAELTPLALLQCLPELDRPNRVVALVTSGAKSSTWKTFSESVQSLVGIEAELVEIPDGRNAEEIRQIIERAAKAFGDDVHLTLDVTQGFRHFPFVLYALALYLTSLRGITLRGAYYGMLEGPDDPKPIVDLKPLLELPEWFHAVRVFRETGSVKSLAKTIQRTKEENSTSAAVDTIVASIEELSFAYESAIPLELAEASRAVSSELSGGFPESVSSTIPLSAQLSALLNDTCRTFRNDRSSLQTELTGKQTHWKSIILLDQDELKNEAKLIDLYLSRDQLPLALGLMREWVVSYLIFRSGASESWLDNSWGGARSSAERSLGALAAIQRDREGRRASGITLDDNQKAWAEFWNRLTELRNELHHHGMKKPVVVSRPPNMKKVLAFWNSLKAFDASAPDLPALGGSHGNLLLTALGTTPGVLFSALKNAPGVTRCIVICSEQSRLTIESAAGEAGFSGKIKPIQMADPHGGYPEEEKMSFEAESKRWLLESDSVLVNLTGGTTLMGMAVQNLADAARSLNRDCRRFVLVDRRPPDQQRSHPFEKGEVRWLDTPLEITDADD
ncbi:TM1812 family CRISPR-associated protein [Thalassoglobus polymorphus]|uniref:CRISPR-associated (Cas) DxTHG family protein n=1 Tax=Thalassoglobus polymorphus TaxID=2527994 RepID=A0A517QHV7_9PLAN|nr:TM1812 family CRISPR-associated protein [Thalassoglobus polymorphus]QDT31137.1 CRISPR-associated (Cas) DxTHG family protein [Thalassoglobus polymorphus]